ncbi:hypothetical protein BKI52_21755 [marine bacterium AO1-C]|nr:hypothetical protein BKI52_21755 [marine bacterium AO1-C]
MFFIRLCIVFIPMNTIDLQVFIVSVLSTETNHSNISDKVLNIKKPQKIQAFVPFAVLENYQANFTWNLLIIHQINFVNQQPYRKAPRL